MKIPGVTSGANPQTQANPSRVDEIMKFEYQRLESDRQKKVKNEEQKESLTTLDAALGELQDVSGQLSDPNKFKKMKVESSHPELVQGELSKDAKPGEFTIEVDTLAQKNQLIDAGFADKDSTPVGFGYLEVSTSEGKKQDVVIEPGSTLSQAADQINKTAEGVEASIINTGIGEEPYRLVVKSARTGEEANIRIDSDTTFLDFEENRKASHLEAKIDDVEVERMENSVDDLVEGLKLDFKKAEPGTKVQIKVETDIEATLEQVKNFATSYNKIIQYANEARDGNGSPGSEANMRQIVRNLQQQVRASVGTGKYSNLSQIGITTNPKSGELEVNDEKLSSSIKENFQEVAQLVSDSSNSNGIAGRLEGVIKSFKDPQFGSLTLRRKSVDKNIKNQEEALIKKEDQLGIKREKLTETFQKIDQSVARANEQAQYFAGQISKNV